MNKIEKAVKKILEALGIKSPPVPVDLIAENLGASIFFEPFEGQDDVSGMLLREGDRKIIGINSSHHPNRQRFSIAHEIGHLVLHNRDLFVDKVVKVNFRDSKSSLAIDKEEIAANAFAAELLMPRVFVESEIRKLLKKGNRINKDELIGDLAEIFEVSNIAMEYRLNHFGIITSQ